MSSDSQRRQRETHARHHVCIALTYEMVERSAKRQACRQVKNAAGEPVEEDDSCVCESSAKKIKRRVEERRGGRERWSKSKTSPAPSGELARRRFNFEFALLSRDLARPPLVENPLSSRRGPVGVAYGAPGSDPQRIQNLQLGLEGHKGSAKTTEDQSLLELKAECDSGSLRKTKVACVWTPVALQSDGLAALFGCQRETMTGPTRVSHGHKHCASEKTRAKTVGKAMGETEINGGVSLVWSPADSLPVRLPIPRRGSESASSIFCRDCRNVFGTNKNHVSTASPALLLPRPVSSDARSSRALYHWHAT
jgi:hypothetical protein